VDYIAISVVHFAGVFFVRFAVQVHAFWDKIFFFEPGLRTLERVVMVMSEHNHGMLSGIVVSKALREVPGAVMQLGVFNRWHYLGGLFV